jgi:ADP-ribose pyrophosphatase
MPEEIISTERKYTGRLIHLDVHQVRLPDGGQSVREQITHPGAVAVVALIGDDVLMVRQYRLASGHTLLEIPAGTLEPGEDPAICAARELQEETGFRPGSLRALGGFFVAPGYTTEYIHLFLARDLEVSRLSMDDDEFIELVRMPLKEALQQAMDGKIIDAKTLSGLLKTARLLGV